MALVVKVCVAGFKESARRSHSVTLFWIDLLKTARNPWSNR